MDVERDPVSYHFGPFELQPAERRLLQQGRSVALSPRSFELLVALVESRGHLLGRRELLARVWRGVIVEENSLEAQISILRRLLGKEAIATVARGGYRFTLDVSRTSGRPPAIRHNLLLQATSFIGREREIGDVHGLLKGNRLLTLIGTGGCGKTRLALQAAAGVLADYPDGVWLLELAGLLDGATLPRAAAEVLRIDLPNGSSDVEARPPVDAIVEALQPRRALLILDNAEHLLDDCARFVDSLVARTPAMSVLVTSRERLAVAGEQTYRVPPLSAPAPPEDRLVANVARAEAVRLFVDRARLQVPTFAVDAHNAPLLATLCRGLDGMPLALELAAPRLHSMTIDELVGHLDERFALLRGGMRTALPRQRTLRALMDWSYDLLTGAERALFARLSVFAGGASLDAVRQVCTGDGIADVDVLDLVTSLVDKSLVTVEAQNGATRYAMLETVRQYAFDRLGEAGDPNRWRLRHLEHVVGLAEDAQESARGPDQRATILRLGSERANLAAALAWSLNPQGDGGAALRLAGALIWYWAVRGQFEEGLGWLARVLSATPDDASDARARALNGACFLACQRGRYPEALDFGKAALAIWRPLGYQRGIAATLNNLAGVLRRWPTPDFAAAMAHCEQALPLWRASGDRWGEAVTLGTLGDLAYQSGDPARARGYYTGSLGIRRELGDQIGINRSLAGLLSVAILERDLQQAKGLLSEAIRQATALSDQAALTELLEDAARVAALSEDYLRALRLWAAVERLRDESGAVAHPEVAARRTVEMEAVRMVVKDGQLYASARDEGFAMSSEAAVEQALGLCAAATGSVV